MTNLKPKPVRHDHRRIVAEAGRRPGFSEAYESLELEYDIASQMLKARARVGLTQESVADRMGTTKSAICRLEAGGRHAPSLASLKKYAAAVGCELQVRFVPRAVPNARTRAAMQEARRIAERGGGRFTSADALFRDLEKGRRK